MASLNSRCVCVQVGTSPALGTGRPLQADLQQQASTEPTCTVIDTATENSHNGAAVRAYVVLGDGHHRLITEENEPRAILYGVKDAMLTDPTKTKRGRTKKEEQ